MQVFIRKPSVELFPGVKVTKETELEYETENVKQTVKDLVLHTVTKTKGDGYEGVFDSTVYLKEGDILIYEDKGRGYIKPVDGFMSVTEAIEELECIEDVGVENVSD